MIGISCHYVRRKYIYGGNLAYQAGRARRGNAPPRAPAPRLPGALSIEIHRRPDKLPPWNIRFESPAASQFPVSILCWNHLSFAVRRTEWAAGTSGGVWMNSSQFNKFMESYKLRWITEREEQTDSKDTKLRKTKCTQQGNWRNNETKRPRRKIKLQDAAHLARHGAGRREVKAAANKNCKKGKHTRE